MDFQKSTNLAPTKYEVHYSMISRRIIRTKVLQVLYAYYASPEKSISNTEKELFFCIQKSYDLYHYLFGLVIEIADYAENRIEIRKNKHQPTEEDLNPNTKFVQINNYKLISIRKNSHGQMLLNL